jgi:hypothetical protein
VATQIVQAPTSADHADTFRAIASSYRSASARAARLAAAAETGPLSDLDADSLVHAADLAADCRATLTEAGRLDLIQPALSPELERAAVRYGICRDRLADLEQRTLTTVVEFDQLASAQAGLAEARDVLVKAGRLDLIGGA